MSTKATVVYLPEEDIHVYEDVFGGQGVVHLEVPLLPELTISGSRLTFNMPKSAFWRLVDAAVKVRDEEERARVTRYNLVMACLVEHGRHDYKASPFGTYCCRCHAHAGDVPPSTLELIAYRESLQDHGGI